MGRGFTTPAYQPDDLHPADRGVRRVGLARARYRRLAGVVGGDFCNARGRSLGDVDLQVEVLLRWSEEAPAAEEDRSRARRILNIMRFVGGIPAFLCAFGLWASIDYTLHPEQYFLRHVIVGLVLVGGTCLLFAGAIKRTFTFRDDEVAFWFLAALFAVILVPGAIHFLDKELAEPTTSRQVEITGLYESLGRRGKVKRTATILVDGRSKELRLDPEEWEQASDLDAMELRIGSGPFGIDHILGWHTIRRSREIVEDAVAAD